MAFWKRIAAVAIVAVMVFNLSGCSVSRANITEPVEDFRSIEELDETYVYALFVICDTETFNVVLEALGYEDLADYLIKRNYVDEEGNPDLIVWTVKNMEEMSEIMVEKSRELEYWSKVTMKETGRT